MPDPIKAMEIMSQLGMEGGKEPPAKARSMANDKASNPEVAEKFKTTLEEAKKYWKDIAEQGKNQGDIKKQYWDINPPKSGGGGAMPKSNRDITKNYKAGGKVSKALKSAGFYAKGTTKSEREKIVSKVTTKPQRIGMVEKLFSAKKMKAGGMASKRADGIAIRGRTKI